MVTRRRKKRVVILNESSTYNDPSSSPSPSPDEYLLRNRKNILEWASTTTTLPDALLSLLQNQGVRNAGTVAILIFAGCLSLISLFFAMGVLCDCVCECLCVCLCEYPYEETDDRPSSSTTRPKNDCKSDGAHRKEKNQGNSSNAARTSSSTTRSAPEILAIRDLKEKNQGTSSSAARISSSTTRPAPEIPAKRGRKEKNQGTSSSATRTPSSTTSPAPEIPAKRDRKEKNQGTASSAGKTSSSTTRPAPEVPAKRDRKEKNQGSVAEKPGSGPNRKEEDEDVVTVTVIDRQKMKEAEEFKRAIEGEWAARHREVQRQGEEARRERRERKKKNRKNKEKTETSTSSREDEDELKHKDKLRDEITKELKGCENCVTMSSLLRTLGIQIGDNPSPKQVKARFKQACLKFHPDKLGMVDLRHQIEAEEKLKIILKKKEECKVWT